jgi:hypothetical protein
LDSKKRIAVYAVIFGPYDGLLPQPTFDAVDYICFTDQDFKSKTWKINKITPPIPGDSTRSARFIKINPHLFLKDYDVSVFIDGNYLIEGDLPSLVSSALKHSPMAIYDHNQCSDPRDCAYDELEAILALQKARNKLKDDPQTMIDQLSSYEREGFPRHAGLIFSAVLVRAHHNDEVKLVMATWWRQIEDHSKRDQLSFNYSAWKHEFKPYYIPGDLRNNQYFYLLSKHRKDYRWKYLKYQIKKTFGWVNRKSL